jgi:NADPH:quinone reductase-like Zn-dependent oxidoreductase
LKAVRIHEFGNADVLKIEEIDAPKAGPGEVTIAIKASGLNHLDVDVREGISRFPVSFPHTMGIEVAGDIIEIGDGVEGWSIGDRVNPYVMAPCERCEFCRTGRESICVQPGFISFSTGGGYAEQVAVKAAQLIKIPDSVSYEEAAATQVAFGTAWHMLFTRGRLSAGESVLVNAVGSGIGSAAVQLARHLGALVIGNASSQEKLDRATELGMDFGINRLDEDIAARVMEITDSRGVDLVFEHVGGEMFQASIDSMSKDGRLVTCGGHAGEVVDFDIIPFFRAQKSVIGSFAYTREEADRCYALAARGAIKPLVHAAFPLEEAAEAMRMMERREQFGKIVLTS